MSYSLTRFGAVIHSSPCVGCQAWPAAKLSIGDVAEAVLLRELGHDLGSRGSGPLYSADGRTRWYGTSSSTWCMARSPETSLMIAVICVCGSSVRSSRSCAVTMAANAMAAHPAATNSFLMHPPDNQREGHLMAAGP